MREIERRSAYRSPSPASVRSTLSRFRPRPLRRLGTVLIRAIGEGVRLMLEPEVLALEMRKSRSYLSSPKIRSLRHPSSASRRLLRFGREKAAE